MFTGIKGLQEFTGLGKNNAMHLGELAGARVRFGRRVIYDLDKVQEYLDSLKDHEKGENHA